MLILFYSSIGFLLGWSLSTYLKWRPLATTSPRSPTRQINSAQTSTVSRANNDTTPANFHYDKANSVETENKVLSQKALDLTRFNDDTQTLSQRLAALRLALRADNYILNTPLIEQLYCLLLHDDEVRQHDFQVLVDAGEKQHPVDITYMLGLLQGKVDIDKLPGLEPFLLSASGEVRKQALITIAMADTKSHYRKQLEYISSNDPDTHVRETAFSLLEQYYRDRTSRAA